MKIFLTEFAASNKSYAGPNIIAENLRSAEIAAFQNGLVVIGELDSLYVIDANVETEEKPKNKDNVIPFPKNKTIH